MHARKRASSSSAEGWRAAFAANEFRLPERACVRVCVCNWSLVLGLRDGVAADVADVAFVEAK